MPRHKMLSDAEYKDRRRKYNKEYVKNPAFMQFCEVCDRNTKRNGPKGPCTACQRRAYNRTNCEIHVDRNRKSLLKTKYGLTVEQFEELWEKQNFLCAICKRPPPSEKRPSIDHDHQTGIVRGLLCHLCNTKLDWALNYRSAIDAYIEGVHLK